MRVQLDTNILTRAAQPGHPMHKNALDALDALRQRGDELYIIPQNLYEFWVVATRPLSVNGLGMSTVQAETEITQIKRLLRFLGDTPAVYPEWEKRVLQHSVSGKSAHDARIVAAMTVHHLSHVLTFNADDFKRFSDIDVLTPDDVLTGKLPLPPTKDTEE